MSTSSTEMYRILRFATVELHFAYDSDGDDFNNSDLMTKIGNDSLSWNANGNLDNSITATFGYDHDNKLRYAFTDSNSIEIRYDPRGNRIYKGKFDSDGKIIKKRKLYCSISNNKSTVRHDSDLEQKIRSTEPSNTVRTG